MNSTSAADEPSSSPGLDTRTAHPARMYDYWLGGRDNFAADREAAWKMTELIPETPVSCTDNRGFLLRAAGALAASGIRSFLDVGSGLPTVSNTHEVVQKIAPESRIVYVDHDPVVLVHGRALLTSRPEGRTSYVQQDLRNPEAILDAAAQTLDLRQPVAVILAAILHFLTDQNDPAGIVHRFMDQLPEGSALVLSHMTGDGTSPQYARHIEDVWAGTGNDFALRSRDQIAAFFDGLELWPPGIVPVHQWRNDPFMGIRRNWFLWSGVAQKKTTP